MTVGRIISVHFRQNQLPRITVRAYDTILLAGAEPPEMPTSVFLTPLPKGTHPTKACPVQVSARH